MAGTQAAPEVADPDHDTVVILGPAGPLAPTTTVLETLQAAQSLSYGGDIIGYWISGENATHIQATLQTSNVPNGLIGEGLLEDLSPVGGVLEQIVFTLHMAIGATDVPSTATFQAGVGGYEFTVGGAATLAVLDGTLLNFTIPKSAFTGAVAGAVLTGLSANAVGHVTGIPMLQVPAATIEDRAPDGDAIGTPYTLLGGSGGGTPGGFPNGAPGCVYRTDETNKTDNDADCLPDRWETQFFGGIAPQNGTMDPDGDGASNYAEYIAGTDPTNPASKPGSGGTTFPNGNPACTYKVGETNKNDTDGDCLPNYWETQFFGNATAALPNEDSDGDGATNREEYLAGTNPKDANSKPVKNPDGAPGCTYKAGETNKTDTDGDCLPDKWEKDNFGNLGQDGTGDPDADGCDNRCEYLNGTDPNKADTDGDGANDGDEVDAGTDPNDPNSKPADDAAADDDSLMGRLKANTDYLQYSTAGALGVLVTCGLALARRWAL